MGTLTYAVVIVFVESVVVCPRTTRTFLTLSLSNNVLIRAGRTGETFAIREVHTRTTLHCGHETFKHVNI